MVSDNAAIFTSQEFKYFCPMNGIKQKFIAPGHQATNGLAERNVQTLKDILKLMSTENLPIHLKVQRIFFRYRATPLANGKSPAEMYLKRHIRIKLDAMFPHYEMASEQKIKPRTRIIKEGERVRTKFFVNNKPNWKLGVITQQLGHLHYIVKLDEEREVKRHINQMQKSAIQKEEVISNAPTSNSKPSLSEDYNPDYYEFINPPITQTNRLTTDRDLGDYYQQQRFSPRIRRSARFRRPPAYLQDCDLS
ncbi:hypothetical protein AVEN_262308-1 [Araneus ventricosus]|uniref:Integrase catalytic domain-containing protein n=1 Tax=Araneus ventricosus TaxID=182803 RepID=A0A4Y2RB87_ARAVE|nr:hypothetical protein AVEN_262308-1 [Araneus ventricosus]